MKRVSISAGSTLFVNMSVYTYPVQGLLVLKSILFSYHPMKKVGGSQQKRLSKYPQCMVYFSNGDNLEMYLQYILLPMLPVHLCRLLSAFVNLNRESAIMIHEVLST